MINFSIILSLLTVLFCEFYDFKLSKSSVIRFLLFMVFLKCACKNFRESFIKCIFQYAVGMVEVHILLVFSVGMTRKLLILMQVSGPQSGNN